MIKSLALFTLLAMAIMTLPANALADSCAAALTSLYIFQSDTTITDADALAAVDGWQLGSRYQEAIGRPEYTLYGETDGTDAGMRYLLVYASRASSERVVVFDFSDERMFGRHADPDLHNHPDCRGGTLPRAELEALLEVES